MQIKNIANKPSLNIWSLIRLFKWPEITDMAKSNSIIVKKSNSKFKKHEATDHVKNK